MLSDLLASVAPGASILVGTEDYLLARVEVDGREMLAEVSSGSAGGIRPGEWPRVDGVLPPDSTICPGNRPDTRILLFGVPDGGRLLLERLAAGGPMSEESAAALGIGMLEVLRRLHQEGARVGYLGPENVLLTPGGSPMILAGARGVPDSPFSPQEAVGRSPEDPRSDVFALGLLMFRAIAGSDSRERQIDAWNALSPEMTGILEGMIAPDPADRLPNLAAVSAGFETLRSMPPGSGSAGWMPREGGRRRRLALAWIIPAFLAAAALVYLLVLRPGGDDGPGAGGGDSTSAAPPESLQPTAVDTIPAVPADPVALPAEPVIWVSNGSGRTGAATSFREGPAASISSVYTCTASPRRSSLLLVRRDDPTLPLPAQERLFQLAGSLAASDTAMTVSPVDITVLLGSDLTAAGEAGGLQQAAEPAGTLYVDIANHGVTGDFGGAGAATWVRSRIHGGCVWLDGSPWLIRVVDFRDGDLLNIELGIPEELDATAFLFRRENRLLEQAAGQLREAILGDSTTTGGPSRLPPPPDIWVLLGS